MRVTEITSDPWQVDLVVVREGSHTSSERSALRRDAERGRVLRIGHGVYVDSEDWTLLDPEAQHVVRMRAVALASRRPVVFSHGSAAVLHGLPVLRQHLRTVHATFVDASSRSGGGVTGHVFPLLDQEVVEFRGLLATSVGRTVVDVAGARPFEEGVMAADGALRAGVPRELLVAAVELAGPRQAGTRIRDVVAFGHPGADSAAESRFRVSTLRLGVEVPILQYRILREDGQEAFVDAVFERAQAAVEVDGDRKYLDPDLAPRGADRVLVAEKRRQDELLTHFARLVRIGWVQSGSTSLLRPVLARAGVRPAHPRPGIAAYAAAAAAARPRRRALAPRWRA